MEEKKTKDKSEIKKGDSVKKKTPAKKKTSSKIDTDKKVNKNSKKSTTKKKTSTKKDTQKKNVKKASTNKKISDKKDVKDKEVVIKEVITVNEEAKEKEILEEKSIDTNSVIDEQDVVENDVSVEEEKTLDNDINEIRKIANTSVKKDKDDDLYLTRSFKSLRKGSFFKQFMKKILSYVLIFGILFAICYFLLFPYIKKNFFINPKDKINEVMDDVASSIYDLADTYLLSNEYSLEMSFDIKTDNKDYKNISNYIYDVNGSFNRSDYNVKYVIRDKDNKLYNIMNNGEQYISYDNESYFLVNGDKNIWNDNLFSKLEKDEFKYFINKHKDFISDIISNKKMSNSKDTISIVDKKYEVNKYTISFNESDIDDLIDSYKRDVLSDNKIISFYSRFDLDKDSVISNIKEYIKESLTINIYLDNKYTFRGFDIENNGFRDIYYYGDGKAFDIHFNGLDKHPIDFRGTIQDKVLKCDIRYKNTDYGSVLINELSKGKLDIEFNLNDYNGFIRSIDKGKYEVELTYNYGSLKTTGRFDVLLKDNKYISEFSEHLIVNNTYTFNNDRNKFVNELDDLGIYNFLNDYSKKGYLIFK